LSRYLGIDTSNYTTSAAIVEDAQIINNQKMILPVRSGELGVRQNEAVFLHLKQLPVILKRILPCDVESIGVSVCPRNVDGSYMPCFLAGATTAEILADALDLPIYRFSHQQGHICASLFSAHRMDLLCEEFYAVHLSGGTSEVLLVTPSEKDIFDTQIICGSSDLKAGQAIDRIGKMLGMPFPSGKYIDAIAVSENHTPKTNPSVKEMDMSFSGLENICRRMLNEGKTESEICAYCMEYISISLRKCLDEVFNRFGKKQVVFSGGVSSSEYLRNKMQNEVSGIFGTKDCSSDNAVGIAALAEISGGIKKI
jgi:N6-L-threonylcarbamoyladenine synthase